MEDAVESRCKNNLLDLPAEILREIADQVRELVGLDS